MQHSLTEIDEARRMGNCSVCGYTRVKLRDSKAKSLAGRYRCKSVYRRNRMKNEYPYAIYKKDTCLHCGFIPEHSSQLDVDHIDGNNRNNDPANLQTLCANCHRLKTYLNNDSNSSGF